MRIAITAGSRGIANVVSITRTLADFVRECGGVPFIVPAMGSHGGATAEGQLRLLAELGITGDAIGCEIRSSMEVAAVGTVNGDDVCIDKLAAEADGVIVAGRVKPHTDFRGPYESGIMKMLVIGLGKQRGAEFCHNNGMAKMAETIPLLGRVILENVNIVGAVAIIENAYDETCQIHVLRPEDVARREPELLRTAFSLMPRILFPECDLLIVDRIGKNFSGGGMDPNITGTFYDPSLSGGLKCKRVCVLDLSPESHGNFSGLGVCDATTRRVFEKIDADSTYTNALTCKVLADAKIPCVMDNDRECIQMCLKTLPGSNTAAMRVIRIPNSLHIEKIRLSESYYNEAIAHPLIEVLENPAEMRFAATGDLR
ncbi:MAG: nickel-dependent lactate racemase [Planctomycetota bacterium]|nr:nickel-dependent lactate racemase [Planctomycetota bacterium]